MALRDACEVYCRLARLGRGTAASDSAAAMFELQHHLRIAAVAGEEAAQGYQKLNLAGWSDKEESPSSDMCWPFRQGLPVDAWSSTNR